MRRTAARQLNLDCQNLLYHPSAKKVHGLLIDYPAEVLPLLDFSLNEFFADTYPEDDLRGDSLMIRPFNLGKCINTRDLGPADIDRLVTVKGLMLRTSSVIPNVKKAFFQCLVCEQSASSEADRGRITEPTKCPNQVCGALNSMSLIHNRGEYADKQVCRMQEMPGAHGLGLFGIFGIIKRIRKLQQQTEDLPATFSTPLYNFRIDSRWSDSSEHFVGGSR